MTGGRRFVMLETRSHSEMETERIGFEIGSRIDRAICICLTGSLGSGKSVLARGICRGLGVQELVVSPSFILCEEYEGRFPIIHVDLYRLEHEREVEELGLFDRMRSAVVLVEWGDRSAYLRGAADAAIRLEMGDNAVRTIRVECDELSSSIFEGLTS